MKSPSSGKGGWELSEAALEKLLAHLDPDREAAGVKYVDLHLRLSRFFERRRFPPPADHAQEVLDRVTRKLYEGELIRSINAYALKVARLYALELSRRPEEVQAGEDWEKVAVSNKNPMVGEQQLGGDEARLSCLDRCLERLPAPEHRMVIEYFQEEGRAKINIRKALARRLGIRENALRIRVCRTLVKLETCVNECERGGAEGGRIAWTSMLEQRDDNRCE